MYLRPATENAANKEYDEANAEKSDLIGRDTGGTDDDDDDEDDGNINITMIARYCSEVVTLIGVLSYVIFQQGDEIKNQGLAAFTKQLVHYPYISYISKCIIFTNKSDAFF